MSTVTVLSLRHVSGLRRSSHFQGKTLREQFIEELPKLAVGECKETPVLPANKIKYMYRILNALYTGPRPSALIGMKFVYQTTTVSRTTQVLGIKRLS